MTKDSRHMLDDTWLLVAGSPWVATWHGDNADTGAVADWTGWSATLVMRSADDRMLARLSDDDSEAFVALTDSGNITAYLSSDRTAEIPPGQAVFDLQFTDPDGAIWPGLSGRVQCISIEGVSA